MTGKMTCFAMFCLFLFFGSVTAQEWDMTGRIIGTVEIPALHEALNSGLNAESSAPVKIYENPSHESKVSAIVRNWRQIVFVEHGYEQISAVAFERVFEHGPWYKVKYTIDDRKGTDSVSPKDAGKLRTFYDIIQKPNSYMTDAWDHRLDKAPNLMHRLKLFLRQRIVQMRRLLT